MVVSREHMPDAGGISEELEHGIKRDGHCQKSQGHDNGLDRFLPLEVVQDNEEQERIDQDSNQFLPRNVLDVGKPISRDGIKCKRQHGPAERRPEDLRARVGPKPDSPGSQDRHHEPLSD